MKVHSIKRKLEQLNAHPVVTAERTDWGFTVKLRGKIENYYDVLVTGSSHESDEEAAKRDFLSEDNFISIKPYHDQSDPMTDYCAWSFPDTLKSLDHYAQSARGRR